MDHWTGQSFLASFIIRLLDGVVDPFWDLDKAKLNRYLPSAHFESLTGAPFLRAKFFETG